MSQTELTDIITPPHSAITGPQAIFPTDVMTRIISYILLQTPAILPAGPMDMHGSLMLVCKAWKTFIEGTPGFWDSIMFTPQQFRYTHSARQKIFVFRKYIGRAGDNLLSFYFAVDFNANAPLTPNSVYGQGRVKIVHSIILPFVRRIRYLRCALIDEENADFLLNIGRGQFRNLENADITSGINPHSPLHDKISQMRRFHYVAFRSLPNLRVAKFTSVYCDSFNPLDLRVPWERLTALDFKGVLMLPEIFLRIVNQARNLTIAAFHIQLHAGSRFSIHALRSMARPITLQYLRVFHVRLFRPSYYPEFLGLFVLPVIQELFFEVDDPAKPYVWDLETLRTHLHHSFNTLQTLILSDLTIINPKWKHRCIRRNLLLPTISTNAPSSKPRRAQCAYHMDELFKSLSGLRVLSFPPDVYFHIGTLEKIATGELLPRLQSLGLGTHHPDVVFSIVRIRAQNASASASGSVSVGRQIVMMRPNKIISLDIVLPYSQLSAGREIETEMSSLRLLSKRVRFSARCSCIECAGLRIND